MYLNYPHIYLYERQFKIIYLIDTFVIMKDNQNRPYVCIQITLNLNKRFIPKLRLAISRVQVYHTVEDMITGYHNTCIPAQNYRHGLKTSSMRPMYARRTNRCDKQVALHGQPAF